MQEKVDLNSKYSPSDDVVAREIEGELIIVPLVSGIGDMEDELYTLNETGKAIWKNLDGKNSINDVVNILSKEYDTNEKELLEDICGLVAELVKRQMLVKL